MNSEIKYHLCLLLCALSRVSKDFIQYHEFKKNHKEILQNERVFAYELYRQWANLLELKKSKYKLNAEKKKCGNFFGFPTKEGAKENGNDIYPDLVLHENNNPDSNNLIVVEIKMNKYRGYTSYIEDIKSLLNMTSKTACLNNPYKLGIFLLIGNNNNNNKREQTPSNTIYNILTKRISKIDVKENSDFQPERILLISLEEEITVYLLKDYIEHNKESK